MSIWGGIKRVGAAIGTGGLSEGYGFRSATEAASGNDYLKDLLFGGKAAGGIDSKPQQYDAATAQLGQMAAGAQGRAAPVAQAAQLGAAYQLAPGQMNESRAGAMGVANRLGAVATGQQAGAGELAINRQLGAANAAQISAARGARGAQSAIAYRNAMRNQMDMGLQGAGLAAGAQMQDQQAANAQLGGLYQGLYGQDAGVAAQNAQLGQQVALQQGAFNQQTGLANQAAQLQQQQMNDAMQITALGQQLGWDQARIQAEIAKAQIAAGDKGILPGLLTAGGTAAMAYGTGGASLGMKAAQSGGVGGTGGGDLMNPYA